MDVEEGGQQDCTSPTRYQKARPEHFKCDGCNQSFTASHSWFKILLKCQCGHRGALYFCFECQNRLHQVTPAGGNTTEKPYLLL